MRKYEGTRFWQPFDRALKLLSICYKNQKFQKIKIFAKCSKLLKYKPQPPGGAETHQNELRRRAGPFCALRVVFNTFLHTPGTESHAHERLARRKFVKMHTKKRLKAERGANTFSKRLAVLSPRPASRRRTTGDAEGKKGDTRIRKRLGRAC